MYVTNGERYDFSHFFSTIQFFCCTIFVPCADPSCAAVIYHHDQFLCNFIYSHDSLDLSTKAFVDKRPFAKEVGEIRNWQ